MSSMYSLTAMTGKEASASRTVVIGTVEINYRVWIILIWSTLPAILTVFMLWTIVGQYGIFALPLVWGGAIFMLHRRSRTGLRLRTYQAMWDKKRATTNRFFLCGIPIEINRSDYRQIAANAVAYAAAEEASSESLVDTLARVPVPAGVTPVAVMADPTRASRPAPRSVPTTTTTTAIPAAPAPAPVPVSAVPDPLDDPTFAAGYAAGLDARERRAREAAQRHDMAQMLGEEDAWSTSRADLPSPRRVAAPPAVTFAPTVAESVAESVAQEVAQPAPFPAASPVTAPVVEADPIDHLDPALIGVEVGDQFDPADLMGADASAPTPTRPFFGRPKDQP